MKKLIISSAIALSGLFYLPANAQIRLHIGLGFPPRQAYYPEPAVAQEPVYNDQDNDFYYLPDVDAYYSVNEQCYYYFDGENWVPAAYLPGQYRDYDWTTAPRLEVRAPRPYLNDSFYRERYNGHEIREWGHRNYDNHLYGAYAGRGYRNNEHNFDNRFNGGYSQHFNNWDNRNNNPHFGGSRQEGYGQPEHRFDNGRQRADGQYGQPNRENRVNGQEYGNGGGERFQPSNPNAGRENQNKGNQNFEREDRSNGQQSNPGAGHNNQNRGGGQFNQSDRPGREQSHRFGV